MPFHASTWVLGIVWCCVTCFDCIQATPTAPYTTQVGQSQEIGTRHNDYYYRFRNTCYEQEDTLQTGLSQAVDEDACLAACKATAYCEAVVIPVGPDAGNPCLFASRSQVGELSDCSQVPSNIEVFVKPQTPEACRYIGEESKGCAESNQRMLLGTFTKVVSPGGVVDRDRCRVQNSADNAGTFHEFFVEEQQCQVLCEDTSGCVAYEHRGPTRNGQQPPVCEIHFDPVTHAISSRGSRRRVCFTYSRVAAVDELARCQSLARVNLNCGPTVQYDSSQRQCYCSLAGSEVCTIQELVDTTLYRNTCLEIPSEAVISPTPVGSSPPTPNVPTSSPTPNIPTSSPTPNIPTSSPTPNIPTSSPTKVGASSGSAVESRDESFHTIGVSSGILITATLCTVTWYLRQKPISEGPQETWKAGSGPGGNSGRTMNGSTFSSTTAHKTEKLLASTSLSSTAIKSSVDITETEASTTETETPGTHTSYHGTIRASQVMSVQSPSIRLTKFISGKLKVPPQLPPRRKTAASPKSTDALPKLAETSFSASEVQGKKDLKGKRKKNTIKSEKLFSMV